MGPARFERATSCSGGKRSIQLSYGPGTAGSGSQVAVPLPPAPCDLPPFSIGAPGFEPGTSCSRSRRATRLRYAPSSVRRCGRGAVVRRLLPHRGTAALPLFRASPEGFEPPTF